MLLLPANQFKDDEKLLAHHPRFENNRRKKAAIVAMAFMLVTGLHLTTSLTANADTDARPNIIVILADDMGYGDTQPLNPDSKIPTPAFNRLAKEGITFTDAHSGSGVCTPTRYGLVCGKYSWRTSLKRGVLGGYSKPLIAKDQQTIASVLKKVGYETACIGKWHLGLGWQWREKAPDNINFFGIAGQANSVDYSAKLTDTPIHHGFDFSYIIPASLDMSPYVYIANDQVTAIPDKVTAGVKFPAFSRKGEIAPDFKIMNCLDDLTNQATKYISEKANKQKPFFLYMPLPAPHKPVIPTPAFQGKSELGPYGDFIMQVDSSMEKIMTAIDSAGIADNTLLMFTSDNGSFMRRFDDVQDDHVTKSSVQGYMSLNHTSNGPLRGTKADIWEGGHRVPFFVRWPGKAKANSRESKTICHVDIMATAAEIAGAEVNRDHSSGSPDSFSFAAQLSSKFPTTARPPVIHHSSSGMYAIRDGNWKLVLGNGSGGRAKPKGQPFGTPFLLFDMSDDIAETNNKAAQQKEVVATLTKKFWAIAGDDPPKPNATEQSPKETKRLPKASSQQPNKNKKRPQKELQESGK